MGRGPPRGGPGAQDARVEREEVRELAAAAGLALDDVGGAGLAERRRLVQPVRRPADDLLGVALAPQAGVVDAERSSLSLHDVLVSSAQSDILTRRARYSSCWFMFDIILHKVFSNNVIHRVTRPHPNPPHGDGVFLKSKCI